MIFREKEYHVQQIWEGLRFASRDSQVTLDTSEFHTPRPCTTALRHADAKAESGSPDARKNIEEPSWEGSISFIIIIIIFHHHLHRLHLYITFFSLQRFPQKSTTRHESHLPALLAPESSTIAAALEGHGPDLQGESVFGLQNCHLEMGTKTKMSYLQYQLIHEP